MKRYEDSAGKRIMVGQLVRHRGELFEVESFSDQGAARSAVINFVGTDIQGDETSVYLIPDRDRGRAIQNKARGEYPRLVSSEEWDAEGDWMSFIKGCRDEWQEKTETTWLPEYEESDLREDILDRIFHQLDILEKR